MTLATLPEEVVTETAMMTAAAVEVTVADVITIVATEEDDVTIVTVDMAETVTTMPPVESTATPAMTDTAVVVMTDVEAAVATLIVMSVVATVAQLAMPRPQPPMVIQLLEESPGNHMEVEASMKIDLSVVNIDC